MSDQGLPPPPPPPPPAPPAPPAPDAWSEPGAPPPPPPPGAPAAPTSDERTFALLIHLVALVSSFVGPIVLWLIKKDTSAYVDHHGKEALNFQITTLIVFAALFVLSCVPLVGLIAIPGFLALGVGHLICLIMAAMKANEGVLWRYPFSIRFIK